MRLARASSIAGMGDIAEYGRNPAQNLTLPALSGRCALLLLLQAAQVIGGALRVGCGGEYRPLVFLQHRQPVPEIGGVVFPHFRRDAQFRAQESGSQFRNEFLAGIAVIAETLGAEIAVKPVLRVSSSGSAHAGRWRNSSPCP